VQGLHTISLSSKCNLKGPRHSTGIVFPRLNLVTAQEPLATMASKELAQTSDNAENELVEVLVYYEDDSGTGFWMYG